MNLKASIIALLNRAWDEEQAFIDSLTDAERAASGTRERWAAKDIVCHIASWNEHMAQTMEGARRGEAPAGLSDDIDAINAEIFEKHCHRDWPDVLRYAETSQKALAAQVQAFDEAILRDKERFAWLHGQPLWRRVVGNGYTHRMMHLVSFWAEHGDAGRALETWQQAAGLLDPLDDSPSWHGTNRYNIACGYALAGMKAQAIDTLREALRLNPSLVQWSKDDSDFNSLRQEPAFQALYNE